MLILAIYFLSSIADIIFAFFMSKKDLQTALLAKKYRKTIL